MTANLAGDADLMTPQCTVGDEEDEIDALMGHGAGGNNDNVDVPD